MVEPFIDGSREVIFEGSDRVDPSRKGLEGSTLPGRVGKGEPFQEGSERVNPSRKGSEGSTLLRRVWKDLR